MTVKSCGEFQENLNLGSRFRLPENAKFLRAGKKVKISSYFGWFFLKDELLDQKNGQMSLLS